MRGEVDSAGQGIDGRLAESTILLTGSTGFLGKAVLSTLLRLGSFRRVLLLVRAADTAAAQERLEGEVLGSEAFADLPEGAVASLLGERRIIAVAGDLEHGRLDVEGQSAWAEVDTVIHCAASVSFEDPLDDILALNAFGPLRLLESLREAGDDPHFVHVSTAYVADCRQRRVGEDGPRHPGLAGLDPGAMLALAQEWRAGVEEESLLPAQRKRFTREAGRDAAHRPDLDPEERADELRQRWVSQQLARSGRRYAMEAGWPDTYALTKALGERLLRERYEQTTIVRPSIVESALSRPRPGWLEGIKVADPLILAYAARGLTHLPGRATNLIDIVPVDHVANACLAAAAYPQPGCTIAVTSSACNPLSLGELAGHIRTHFREQPLRRRNGRPIEIGELQFVDRKQALRKAMRREALAGVAARLGASGPMATEKKLRRTSTLAAQVTRMVKIYGPYTELNCAFENANARALAGAMSAADRAALPFDAAALDWAEYLGGTHLPEVQRMAERPRAS